MRAGEWTTKLSSRSWNCGEQFGNFTLCDCPGLTALSCVFLGHCVEAAIWSEEPLRELPGPPCKTIRMVQDLKHPSLRFPYALRQQFWQFFLFGVLESEQTRSIRATVCRSNWHGLVSLTAPSRPRSRAMRFQSRLPQRCRATVGWYIWRPSLLGSLVRNVVTSDTQVVTGALLVVTKSY